MQLIQFLVTVLVFTLTPLQAQISVPGRYRHLVRSSFQKRGEMTDMTIYTMPEQDNNRLLADAKAEEAQNSAKISRKVIKQNPTDGLEEISYPDKPPKTAPFVFGKVLPLSVDMSKEGHGQWIINEENKTKMWRFRVNSKDAISLSIYFSDFHLAPSTELYIIGAEDTLGAFTSINNKEERSFGIAPVSGDFLVLEYVEPLDGDFKGEVSSIVVSHVVHGFRQSPFSLKAGSGSGNCNINVACPEGSGKSNSINSVALLISGKGNSFCTGAMVNNANQDGRQFFLTADHCIGDSNVSNLMAGFHYQYKYCNSFLEMKPITNIVHGMKLIDKSSKTDYALLEIIERIPESWDVYMAGWDATGSSIRSGSFYGIHHPSGDPKKVSLFTGNLDLVRLIELGNGYNFWKLSKWDKGVTEPGSSGSPLFDSNGFIVGHLLGGDSSCDDPKAPDYYGAFSRDWTLTDNPIKKYLDPNDTNGMQLRGAPLKQLRSDPVPQNPTPTQQNPDPNPTTITVTQTRTNTITVTETVARTTKLITSKLTVTVQGELVTTTREIIKTVPVQVTVTTTFTRIPPPIVSVRTVTVVKH